VGGTQQAWRRSTRHCDYFLKIGRAFFASVDALECFLAKQERRSK
jgi:hypothetical protein